MLDLEGVGSGGRRTRCGAPFCFGCAARSSWILGGIKVSGVWIRVRRDDVEGVGDVLAIATVVVCR